MEPGKLRKNSSFEGSLNPELSPTQKHWQFCFYLILSNSKLEQEPRGYLFIIAFQFQIRISVKFVISMCESSFFFGSKGISKRHPKSKRIIFFFIILSIIAMRSTRKRNRLWRLATTQKSYVNETRLRGKCFEQFSFEIE